MQNSTPSWDSELFEGSMSISRTRSLTVVKKCARGCGQKLLGVGCSWSMQTTRGWLTELGTQSSLSKLHRIQTYLSVNGNSACSSVQFSSVQSLSHVWLFATLWIAACQASPSITNSRSSPRLTSIESVMSSSHLILCRPLLLLPPIPPSIRVFSNESTLCMSCSG